MIIFTVYGITFQNTKNKFWYDANISPLLAKLTNCWDKIGEENTKLVDSSNIGGLLSSWQKSTVVWSLWCNHGYTNSITSHSSRRVFYQIYCQARDLLNEEIILFNCSLLIIMNALSDSVKLTESTFANNSGNFGSGILPGFQVFGVNNQNGGLTGFI